MPNVNGKTSSFLNAINKYAQEQRTKIITEAEEFKQQEIEKAESEALNDAYALIQKEMAEMRNGISREVSRKEMEGRKVLFERRKAIMDDVFKKSKDKLLEYTKTAEYVDLMKKYAIKVLSKLNKDKTVIYIKEEDSGLINEILLAVDNKCKVETTKNIAIGGMYGYNESMGMIADETLDSKLEEQRRWFAENSGLRLV